MMCVKSGSPLVIGNRLQHITDTPEVESIVPIRSDVKHATLPPTTTHRWDTRFLDNFRVVRTSRAIVRIVRRHLISVDDVDSPLFSRFHEDVRE